MKKEYLSPTMRVVVLKHKCHVLLGSNNLNKVETNMTGTDDDFIFFGGGAGTAR